MGTPFETFAASLPEDDRKVLHGSIAFVLRVVASADSSVDGKEEKAAEVARQTAKEKLGAAFGEPAASYPDAIAAAGHYEWPSQPFTRQLCSILQKMPKDARQTYDKLVAELGFSVATASGGVLGFGERMSGEERYALRRLVSALRLELDEEAKKRLAL
ncbi:MAG: hypothetical protein ACXWUG_22050 [Polyangiales bacterium]